MKQINTTLAQSIHGGGPCHFHWVCINNKRIYVSKPYKYAYTASQKATAHSEKYKNHKRGIFVIGCERNCENR
jgi:hypothetical protein